MSNPRFEPHRIPELDRLLVLLFVTLTLQGHGLTFIAFASTAATVALLAPRLSSRSPTRRSLNYPLMRWLGKRPHHLYDYPISGSLEAWQIPASLVNYRSVFSANIALSLAVTEASLRIIEQPAPRFKERFNLVPHTVPLDFP